MSIVHRPSNLDGFEQKCHITNPVENVEMRVSSSHFHKRFSLHLSYHELLLTKFLVISEKVSKMKIL
jgi:hypothetical protein